MAYTVKDVLKRLIEIEKEMSRIYYDISNIKDNKYESFKILAKVMGKEEIRHSLYFKKTNDSVTDREDSEIDNFTYDNISQRMYQFKNRINVPKLDRIGELISFINDFEKRKSSVIIGYKRKTCGK